EHFGQRVNVVYNVPGGTSEIRKLLQAQYTADLQRGDTLGGDADLVFGGGSYEHDVLSKGVTVNVEGTPTTVSISAPVDFDDAWLRDIYGDNIIGDITLYDPKHHWFGLALSGFGIVYNRDVLKDLGVDEPETWVSLCDPHLRGWIALVNPGQSGSVTTAFEAILKQKGWDEGWAILRRMGANARYFSASSLKPPTDVSQGDAAMGVSIDFYGRFQAQAVLASVGDDRVGYVDPPGVSTIDPDPISMLRGAPNPVLARRFIEFCLSDEGQALWQFRTAKDGQAQPDGMGPEQFELRRLPIRRSMYGNARYLERFVDNVNPFDLAAPMRYPDRNFRAFIPVLFASMTMESHEALRAAWTAIVEHEAYPADAKGLVRADDVDDPVLHRMLEAFDAFPTIRTPEGEQWSLGDVERLGDIKAGWLRGGWRGKGLWPAAASPEDILRKEFGVFYRAQYERIAEGAHATSG
ncbi:MAG: extracellular solute-binding protein, partial [Phycisphaerales bacterium]|nr:extracellular solute-binding protein [Phycisphaerales bacterium]